MKLGAGIVNGSMAGWEILLRQEGLPFATVSDEPGEFPVLIAFGKPDASAISIIRRHSESGGSLFCSGSVYAALTGSASKKRSISCLLPGNEPPFQTLGLLDIYSMGERIASATHCPDKIGRASVFAGIWNDVPIVVLPFDPGALVLDTRCSTKSFYATQSRLPFERVSLVSKGGVRRLVSLSLEFLHHRSNLPYLHLWPHPAGSTLYSCFRVDTDGTGRDDLERLHGVIASRGIRASWFLDAHSQSSLFPVYASMHGQEIGVHGDLHETYDDYGKNLVNFTAGLNRLRDAGFAPAGAAAPFGIWNDGLRRCYAELGFEYSSEFSYDYDNLPSLPAGESYRSIQLPVHPVSVGSLKRQGYGVEEMREYFTSYIERQIALREPVMLYHHPKNGHEEVLGSLFDLLTRHSVPVRPMNEIARWWYLRWRAVPEIQIDAHQFRAGGTALPDSCRIHCTRNDGSESWFDAGTAADPAALRWSPRPVVPEYPPDLRRTRRFNPWIPVTRAEDYVYRRLRH
jgi:hypothetical protein